MIRKKLNIEVIRIDGGTQPRERIDRDIVDEYAEMLNRGDKFPPLYVFFDGSEYWLADGFHRYYANKKNNKVVIECNIIAGTRRNAILYSVGANHDHGLRRNNADKRRSVMKMLEDPEWGQWSDSEIAKRCKVSHPFVGNMRKEYQDYPHTRVFTHKSGKKSIMNIENIGKNKPVSKNEQAGILLDTFRGNKPGELLIIRKFDDSVIMNIRNKGINASIVLDKDKRKRLVKYLNS